jgi:CRP/FNR family cyclic AMP-dependent transcriptional regulator
MAAFCADPAQPALIKRLAQAGELRHYRKGSVLAHEGDVGDTLFLLLRGRVKIYSVDANDREIGFGIYETGDYFGESSLDGSPRSASMAALEPCTCAVLRRAGVLAFVAQHPEFALEMVAKVNHRLRLTTLSARNLAFLDVYGRLSQLLQALARPQPDGSLLVEERLTHAELASRVGCSREMVSRILKDLETGGYIALRERRIVLVRKLPARW